jgi:hypothetical protein
MSIGSSKWQPWVLDEDKALPLIKACFDAGTLTFLPNACLKSDCLQA